LIKSEVCLGAVGVALRAPRSGIEDHRWPVGREQARGASVQGHRRWSRPVPTATREVGEKGGGPGGLLDRGIVHIGVLLAGLDVVILTGPSLPLSDPSAPGKGVGGKGGLGEPMGPGVDQVEVSQSAH
jgi:hypothetical protein